MMQLTGTTDVFVNDGLSEEVAKGFEQLAAGKSSNQSVMDIFELAYFTIRHKASTFWKIK